MSELLSLADVRVAASKFGIETDESAAAELIEQFDETAIRFAFDRGVDLDEARELVGVEIESQIAVLIGKPMT